MANNPEVSIIIPTRNRSHLLLERFRTLERNTPEIVSGIAEVIVVTDTDDLASYDLVNNNFGKWWKLPVSPGTLPCDKWNQAARNSMGNWLVTMSDDSVPHPNWLTNALKLMTKGFIALPDGVTGNRNQTFTPLYMATRDWLKTYNGGCLVIPVYKTWYADIETAERAHRSGTYILGTNSVVEQLHADFKTADDDSIYQLGRTRRITDLKLYERRKFAGFPNDFESVL